MNEVIAEYLAGKPHSLPLTKYVEAMKAEPLLTNIIFTRKTYEQLLEFKRDLKPYFLGNGRFDVFLNNTLNQPFAPYQWRFGQLEPFKRTDSEVRIHINKKIKENCILNVGHMRESAYQVYKPVAHSEIEVHGTDNFAVFIDYDIPTENLQRRLYPRWKTEETITKEELKNIKNGMIYWTLDKDEIDELLHKYEIDVSAKYDPRAVIDSFSKASTPSEFIRMNKKNDPLIIHLAPLVQKLWSNKQDLMRKLKTIYNL